MKAMGDYHTNTDKQLNVHFHFSIPLTLPSFFLPSLSPSHPPFFLATFSLSSKILPAGGPNGTSSATVEALHQFIHDKEDELRWVRERELCSRQQPHYRPELTEETSGNIPSLSNSLTTAQSLLKKHQVTYHL